MLEIVISLVILTLMLAGLLTAYYYRWEERKDAQDLFNIVNDKSGINNIEKLQRLYIELIENMELEEDPSMKEVIRGQALVVGTEIENLRSVSAPVVSNKAVVISEKQVTYDQLRSDLEKEGEILDNHINLYIQDSDYELKSLMHESVAKYTKLRDAERLFVYKNKYTVRFKKDLGLKFAPCSSYTNDEDACMEEDLCMMAEAAPASCHTPVTDEVCSAYSSTITCNERPMCDWDGGSCKDLPPCPSGARKKWECEVRLKGRQCIFEEGMETSKCVMKPW
jgi:hypothetical protein